MAKLIRLLILVLLILAVVLVWRTLVLRRRKPPLEPRDRFQDLLGRGDGD